MPIFTFYLVNTAAAVSITFFITFIVAVVAVVVAILVTWIITRKVPHEKEFKRTTQVTSETKFTDTNAYS